MNGDSSLLAVPRLLVCHSDDPRIPDGLGHNAPMTSDLPSSPPNDAPDLLKAVWPLVLRWGEATI
jgi:hypothetical protein